MKLERYELKAEESLMVFEFVSEGPKGKIRKLVQFGETNLKGLYNLAFGDLDTATGEINDLQKNILTPGFTPPVAPDQEPVYIESD
jgi:hypothetical protein